MELGIWKQNLQKMDGGIGRDAFGVALKMEEVVAHYQVIEDEHLRTGDQDIETPSYHKL